MSHHTSPNTPSHRRCHARRADHGPDTGHRHGPRCGHALVLHGDHFDYLVDGRLHHEHGDHCHDHGQAPRP